MLQDLSRQMTLEVENYGDSELLMTGTEELVEYLCRKYLVEPLVLLKDDMRVGREEGQFDVRKFGGSWYDEDDPDFIDCTFAVLEIPYIGNDVLFELQPSTYDLAPPAGVVEPGLLKIYVHMTDAGKLKQRINFELERIESNIARQTRDIESYNGQLEGRARRVIETRKELLNKELGALETLGIPLKRREDAVVYAPNHQKKISLERPKASSGKFEPEPALEMPVYEDILAVIQHMTEVMERSPSAFASLGEEDLRTHFLVQLNGTFKSEATGETFNGAGKTDILLRFDGGNAFVAECKFWTGEAAVEKIIDQLMGYVTWRDTKTAILLFSRNKNFSSVIDKAKVASEKHRSFKRSLEYRAANGFRGVYGHPDDSNREVTITTLLFDVPG